MQDKMAETVLNFAKVIKEATASNPKLSVTFYGYGLEHAGTCFLSPAMTGHCATRKVLNSPYIDVLSSPVWYTDRGLGGVRTPQSPAESVTLAKKLWCDEDDNRTYLIWKSGSVLVVVDGFIRSRVVDEKSLCHGGAQKRWFYLMVHNVRRHVLRTGVPTGQYLLEDVLDKKAKAK